MPRIVSLLASATEIVCALGLEDQLVARSHECDHPPSVLRLPCVTETKIRTEESSYRIDERVKAIVQEALSVYRVDGEALQELEPDLIVTQTQCEVCAVSPRDVERAVCAWQRSCPRLVELRPNALSDVWDDISQVAEAAGVPERGEELVGRLKERMQAIQTRTRDVAHRPTVACVEWLAPLMAAGNWMPELVEMAGGVSAFGEVGKHAPWMSWEQLAGRDPEVIALMPCGFDIARIRQELHLLTDRPEWPRLEAVRSGRVFLTDGNQYFNRPGPRLVESLEILAELLHPELFPARHEGSGWQKP
jgi:iron complex transport system substrate-binding protein